MKRLRKARSEEPHRAAPPRRLAVTRAPSPALERAIVTYLDRRPIDFDRACRQHAAYRAELARLGLEVRVLEPAPDLPDAVFVEDTAVVLDEVAVLCSMGAESRRGERAAVEAVLREYRPVEIVSLPATI